MLLENVDYFKELEEEVYQWVCSIVSEKIKEVLKEIDDVIKDSRNKKIFKSEDTKNVLLRLLLDQHRLKEDIIQILKAITPFFWMNI